MPTGISSLWAGIPLIFRDRCLQEGLKKLELLLDSPDFKAQLDRRTSRVWPNDPIPCECAAAAQRAQRTCMLHVHAERVLQLQL